VVKPGGWARQE